MNYIFHKLALMLPKIFTNGTGITMDSVAYRLRSATVPQVVEQYSFQFYLFSLIASVPFAIILKIFFCPLATLHSKSHYLLQKVLQEEFFSQKCVLVLE